ncbi:hypothetical protein [Ktedonobacter robiniae]|uniref:hypothetical protein n=1 Tax=Ktedonobacter robiniae TaxID=2778365 RepID=UPI00191619E1|nr:hypothetical protein [Ktedonobacter robiniae]
MHDLLALAKAAHGGLDRTIFSCVGTTTTLMWQVVFRRRNISTPLWRPGGSAFRPSAMRVCVGQV